MGSNGHSLCVKVGYGFDDLQALHIEAAETQDAREDMMPQIITDQDVDALLAQGWWTVPLHIGGRGDVTHLTDGKVWYRKMGSGMWYRCQEA